MRSTKVSIVVPSYGRSVMIKALIKSIKLSTPEKFYEIVVISSDKSDSLKLKWLKKQPEVRLIQADYRQQKEPRKKSLHYYTNLGIKASCFPWVLVTNDDVIFSKNWYKEWVKVLKKYKDEDMGMVVFSHRNKSEKPNIWLGRIKKKDQPWKNVYLGDFAIIRRDILIKIGCFDEKLDWYGSGLDNVLAVEFLTESKIIFGELIEVNHLLSDELRVINQGSLAKDCYYLKTKWDQWCRENNCQYVVNLATGFFPRLQYYVLKKIPNNIMAMANL